MKTDDFSPAVVTFISSWHKAQKDKLIHLPVVGDSNTWGICSCCGSLRDMGLPGNRGLKGLNYSITEPYKPSGLPIRNSDYAEEKGISVKYTTETVELQDTTSLHLAFVIQG